MLNNSVLHCCYTLYYRHGTGKQKACSNRVPVTVTSIAFLTVPFELERKLGIKVLCLCDAMALLTSAL